MAQRAAPLNVTSSDSDVGEQFDMPVPMGQVAPSATSGSVPAMVAAAAAGNDAELDRILMSAAADSRDVIDGDVMFEDDDDELGDFAEGDDGDAVFDVAQGGEATPQRHRAPKPRVKFAERVQVQAVPPRQGSLAAVMTGTLGPVTTAKLGGQGPHLPINKAARQQLPSAQAPRPMSAGATPALLPGSVGQRPGSAGTNATRPGSAPSAPGFGLTIGVDTPSVQLPPVSAGGTHTLMSPRAAGLPAGPSPRNGAMPLAAAVVTQKEVERQRQLEAEIAAAASASLGNSQRAKPSSIAAVPAGATGAALRTALQKRNQTERHSQMLHHQSSAHRAAAVAGGTEGLDPTVDNGIFINQQRANRRDVGHFGLDAPEESTVCGAQPAGYHEQVAVPRMNAGASRTTAGPGASSTTHTIGDAFGRRVDDTAGFASGDLSTSLSARGPKSGHRNGYTVPDATAAKATSGRRRGGAGRRVKRVEGDDDHNKSLELATNSTDALRPGCPPERRQYRFIHFFRMNLVGRTLRTVDWLALKIIFAATIFLLFCCGAGVIFGTIWSSIPNKRREKIDDYNDAISVWMAHDQLRARAWNSRWVNFRSMTEMPQLNTTMALKHDIVEAKGKNLEGLVSGAPTYYAVSDRKLHSSEAYEVTLDEYLTTRGHPLVFSGIEEKSYTVPDNLVDNGNDRSRHAATLSEVCLVARWTGTRYVPSPKYKSCWWPFTHHRYTAAAREVEDVRVQVTVRLETDPFIQLQEITGGTSTFTGLAKRTQEDQAVYASSISAGCAVPIALAFLQVFAEVFHRNSQMRYNRRTWRENVFDVR